MTFRAPRSARKSSAFTWPRRGRDPAAFAASACAAASPDFSGAEIEEAINSALYDAFHSRREVTSDDILAALAQTVPLARTMDEQISRLRHWADGRARNASVSRPPRPANSP